MTKLRTPDTVEDALDQAVGLVGADIVGLWIGKSADWVRACSNPDNERQLAMRDALVIDQKLALAGHVPVFAELTAAVAASAVEDRKKIEQAFEALNDEEKPLAAAVNMVGHSADLLEQIQKAESDGKVEPRELSALLAGVERLQKIFPKLRRSLFKRQQPAAPRERDSKRK